MTKEKLERAKMLLETIHHLTDFIRAVGPDPTPHPTPLDVLVLDYPGMITDEMEARWRAEMVAKYAPELEKAQAEFDAL